MNQDSGIYLKSLQVDGGMTANGLLMQLQADLTGLIIGNLFSHTLGSSFSRTTLTNLIVRNVTLVLTKADHH